MELYKEIIIELLKKEDVKIDIPKLKADINDIVELECYKALKQIKRILNDRSLSDKECFERIEKIVCVFEAIGSSGGNRHDFG